MIPIALLQALVVMASCIFIDMMYKKSKSFITCFFYDKTLASPKE